MLKKSLSLTTSYILVVVSVFMLMGGLSSCKSKKKLAKEKAAAEYTARVQQAKKDLTAILNNTSPWPLKQQIKRVEVIKSYNIADPEVKGLITKAEEKLKSEQAVAARKAAEEKLREAEAKKQMSEQARFEHLNLIFKQIAEVQSYTEADDKINKALEIFATPEIPVLIIIAQSEGFNDYDRPTTIKKFLNYIKDMKSYDYRVDSIKKDVHGKITELELIKK